MTNTIPTPSPDLPSKVDGLLPECPIERRMFNDQAKLHGDPLLAIAQAMTIWSKMNPAQGSLAKTQAIYANELVKAAKARASTPTDKDWLETILAKLNDAVKLIEGPPGTHLTEQQKDGVMKLDSARTKLGTAIARASSASVTDARDEGHPHLIDGKFQSDKYPTTPRGKVPLSTKDKSAQDLLWTYAQRRRAVDAEFATDLELALTKHGYTPKSGDTETTFEDLEEGGVLVWIKRWTADGRKIDEAVAVGFYQAALQDVRTLIGVSTPPAHGEGELLFTEKENEEAYQMGKRDGYEEAVQDIDLETGGDGEFKGSTFPGETVDVPVMKQRIIDRALSRAPSPPQEES